MVVDGIVRSRGSRLSLLVCMSHGAIGSGPGEARLARWWWLGVIVIVINNDDLFGQAVLVKVGPVRISPPLCRTRVHVERGALCKGRQLWRLSGVGGRGSAEF